MGTIGRPKKNDEDRLSTRLNIRLTNKTSRQLDELSQGLAISKSAVVRMAVDGVYNAVNKKKTTV